MSAFVISQPQAVLSPSHGHFHVPSPSCWTWKGGGEPLEAPTDLQGISILGEGLRSQMPGSVGGVQQSALKLLLASHDTGELPSTLRSGRLDLPSPIHRAWPGL